MEIESILETWQASVAPCGARSKGLVVKSSSGYPRGSRWPELSR